jgi:capsular exopolysaccharide synthesis family protein
MTMTPNQGSHPALQAPHVPAVVTRVPDQTTALIPEPGWTESAAPAPKFSSPFSTGNLLKALRRRWLLALTVGLGLFAALAGAVFYLLPADYTAYALLRVSADEPQPLLPEQYAHPVSVDRYFENTQVALIKSRPIIQAALLREGIGELAMVRAQADPVTWLEESIKVGFLEKTDILRVSLNGHNPKQLAKLVNAIKEAYLEQEVNAQRNKKKSQLDELEAAYDASEKKIRAQREDLRRLAEALKTSDSQALSVKQKAMLEEYAALRKELALLQAQIRGAESLLKARDSKAAKAKDKAADVVPDYLVEQAIDADPSIVQKKMELAQIEAKIESVRQYTKRGHPTLVKYQQQRRSIEKALERARSSRRAAVTRQVRDKMRGDTVSRTEQIRENLELWNRQEEILKGQVAQVAGEAEKIGMTSLELEIKRGEIEQAEAVLKRVRQEKERLQIEVQSNKHRISIVYDAEPPHRKNLAAHLRLVGLAGFAGLGLGLFGIAAWEARARRVGSKEELVREVGVRVIGELPWVQAPARGAQPAEARPGRLDPTLVLSESVDGIRAMLLCDAEHLPGGKVLMITSAVACEGKTTLASRLALSVANAGKRTLLIDCDFRRPELHNIFSVPRGPGLSNVLLGQASTAEAIQPGPISGLSVLPAGDNSHRVNQAELMDRTRQLLEQFRRDYDFILVDCCPVLPVADALLLGRRVDGVLLSVRPHVSQMPQVHAAFDRLAGLRIPVLGAVLNGVQDRPSYSSYRYLVEEKV